MKVLEWNLISYTNIYNDPLDLPYNVLKTYSILGPKITQFLFPVKICMTFIRLIFHYV